MVIDEQLLLAAGAETEDIEAGDLMFREEGPALYYFQVVKGKIKLVNYNEDGKEIIQNILDAGQSVGESILFIDRNYSSTAIALTDCRILKLHKVKLFNLLKDNPDLSAHIIRCLSERLYFKSIMIQNMSSSPPVRLRNLMNYLKSFHKNEGPFQVPLTRQQMANLTGLSVETVIRTIKKMERGKILTIINRKILY